MTPLHGLWRRLALAGLALALALGPVHAQLPTLGDDSELGSAAERRLGERIARELYRDPDHIDDAVVAEYVQGLWDPLLAAARARGDLSGELQERFAWEVVLGKDRSFNAFAVPGGWLGIHLGLIAATSSPEELASVLAHELSHVTQRHISRLLTQQNRQAPWLVAGMILGAIAMGRNAEAGNALIAGSQAVALQSQLAYSRDMEREADRIGLGVLQQAGFDPQGFVSMFEKLQQASRLNDSGNLPYLRTHPLTTERVAEMQSRVTPGARPVSQPAAALEHALVAARARVISNSAVDALRAYVAEADAASLREPGDVRQAAALYAAILASARLRDPQAAARWLDRLQGLAAGDARALRQVRLLEAEVALAAGDAPRALSALEPLRLLRRPELLLGALVRIRMGRAAEAGDRLQPWVAVHPRDATAWELLAAAWADQGKGLRSIRAEAEAQAARLDYAAARDRLKAAQDLARRPGSDFIEASIIDSRARQIDSILREQALER